MSQRTPGPWRRDALEVIGPKGFRVAVIRDARADDADLMVAAPEMLEALRDMVRPFEQQFPGGMPVTHPRAFEIDRARALLARLDGGK